MPSEKAIRASESYHKWMIRTPVISRDKPQETRLAEAFDKFASEQREALEKEIQKRDDRLLLLKDWMRYIDWMNFIEEYPYASEWFSVEQPDV